MSPKEPSATSIQKGHCALARVLPEQVIRAKALFILCQKPASSGSSPPPILPPTLPRPQGCWPLPHSLTGIARRGVPVRVCCIWQSVPLSHPHGPSHSQPCPGIPAPVERGWSRPTTTVRTGPNVPSSALDLQEHPLHPWAGEVPLRAGPEHPQEWKILSSNWSSQDIPGGPVVQSHLPWGCRFDLGRELEVSHIPQGQLSTFTTCYP